MVGVGPSNGWCAGAFKIVVVRPAGFEEVLIDTHPFTGSEEPIFHQLEVGLASENALAGGAVVQERPEAVAKCVILMQRGERRLQIGDESLRRKLLAAAPAPSEPARRISLLELSIYRLVQIEADAGRP